MQQTIRVWRGRLYGQDRHGLEFVVEETTLLTMFPLPHPVSTDSSDASVETSELQNRVGYRNGVPGKRSRGNGKGLRLHKIAFKWRAQAYFRVVS